MTLYNIRTNTGKIMLGMWCDEATAMTWLEYYKFKYPDGKPYPNGKGFYPDFGFTLIEQPS